MKKILLLFVVCISIVQFADAQKIQTYQDSAKAAKNIAKSWLKAWDGGDLGTLKSLSTEGATVCDLSYLTETHFAEDTMTMWGTATWWGVRKDTVEGIIGVMVTASFDFKEGETIQTAPQLPLFVHLNSKGKWVVNIYMSNFCFCESPCDE